MHNSTVWQSSVYCLAVSWNRTGRLVPIRFGQQVDLAADAVQDGGESFGIFVGIVDPGQQDVFDHDPLA